METDVINGISTVWYDENDADKIGESSQTTISNMV